MEIKKKTEKKNIDFSNTQDFHLQQRVKVHTYSFRSIHLMDVLSQTVLLDELKSSGPLA